MLKERNEIKKNKFNIKLSQKTEIMMDYWRLIDEKYFNDSLEKKIDKVELKLETLKKNFLVEKRKENIFLNVNHIISRNFHNDAFFINKNEKLNEMNKNNFKKHFFIGKLVYVNIMHILKNKESICSKCIKKISLLLKNEFKYKIPKKLNEEKGIKKFLLNEEKVLNKILDKKNIGLCINCLNKSKKHNNSEILNEIIKIINQNLKKKKKKFKNLLISLQKKIQKFPLKTNFFEISFEFEQIKKYLFYHLREIEEKLLADSIYRVIGKNKKLIYIEFIQFYGIYPIEIKELKLFNRFRENSLFRIHKASHKTHQRHYVYNDNLKSLIKNKKVLNKKLYSKDITEFSKISTKKYFNKKK